MKARSGRFDVEQGFGLILRGLARRLSSDPRPESASDWQRALLRYARRYEPDEGKGPYPTAILLHGCAGDKPHLETWGRFLAHHNILAYTIDSLSPRGFTRFEARCLVCTGLRLRGRERSRDVTEILPAVLEDPRADRRRIHLVGWSHGAWTIMEWMLGDGAAAFAEHHGLSIASLVLAYPYCGLASTIHDKEWTHPVPVMVVTGGKDFVVPNEKTYRFIERIAQGGMDVTHVHIEGAGHGFDVEGNGNYSAEKTRELKSAVLGFLQRVNRAP